MEIRIKNETDIIIIDDEHLNGYEHINLTILKDGKYTTTECLYLDTLLSALESFKKQRDLDRIREEHYKKIGD